MTPTIEQRLLDDISWRENELAALRATYVLEPNTTAKGRGLRRAYLAMLYAHYEGFCKSAWEECQIEISRCGRTLSQIRPTIASQFLLDEISAIRNKKKTDFIEAILDFRFALLDPVASTYKKFETSNLWPSALIEVLDKFELDTSTVDANRVSLKSLVARRNDIAHGENVGVSDPTINTLQKAVWDVILALLIDIVAYFEDRRFLI